MEGDIPLKRMATSVCGALSACVGGISSKEVHAALALLCDANQVVVFGVGRERLAMHGFAMRLYHIGVKASCVNDMGCPRVGVGDCVLVSAGPGHFGSVEAIVKAAHDAEAKTVCFTADAGGVVPKMCNAVVSVPARTMKEDREETKNNAEREEFSLPMGSAYEGALFILFEIMVEMCRKRLGVATEEMVGRHTNLE